MFEKDYEFALAHHGVKGMHWGVRRTPEQLGNQISKTKASIVKNEGKALKSQTKAYKRAKGIFQDQSLVMYNTRKSLKYQKKALRGKKKLLKLEEEMKAMQDEQKKAAESEAQSETVEHSEFSHAELNQSWFDILETMNDEQKEAVYVLVDDLIEDEEIDSENPDPED